MGVLGWASEELMDRVRERKMPLCSHHLPEVGVMRTEDRIVVMKEDSGGGDG